MKKAILPIAFISILALLGAFLITKEYKKQNKPETSDIPQTEEVVSLDELKATDTVVLVNNDLETKKLSLRHIGTMEDYELSYDGTVPFTNKYGDTITASELMNGEILNIVYSKHSKEVMSVHISDETWTMSDMVDYSIDDNRKMITIMGDNYQYGSDLLVYSEGAPARLMDITDMDTLTIKGYNCRVCSIIINEGHGYLRVKNDAYFIGGFIEVGQKIIRPITEEMLLPVPEGRYKVRVTNRGYAGEENVIIERDKETILDLSKIKVEEVAIGHVQFEITPDFALLYVDGEITDYEERVPLEYGPHKIRVEAAGYKTVETNVKVGNNYANISIDLDLLPEGEEEEKDDKTTEQSSSTDKTPPTTDSESSDSTSKNENTTNNTSNTTESTISVSGTKKIYIESPTGAEAYLDGNYIGVVPVSTGKVTGSHTITLSQSGYQTKSYTIYVENDNNDVTLSFSGLLAE